MEQRAHDIRPQDWLTFTPRPPAWLLIGVPVLWCLASVVMIVRDAVDPHGGIAWFFAFLVPVLLGAALLVMLWRYVRTQQLAVRTTPEELVVRRGAQAPTSVRWADVTRVQEGPQSLVLDLAGECRRLVLSAPSPRFPSQPLLRDIAARLDASRGYQGSLCDLNGEPAPEAMADGGCDNPLGCANAGGCAVAALRSGVGTTPA